LLKANHNAEQLKHWRDGVLFVGSKGMLVADYHKHLLLPEKSFAHFQAPKPFIPDSIGHHEEWIRACKTGSPTTCNFDYSGPLAETVLLGIVAYRSGKKLDYDGSTGRITNTTDANQYLTREYRKGWEV